MHRTFPCAQISQGLQHIILSFVFAFNFTFATNCKFSEAFWGKTKVLYDSFLIVNIEKIRHILLLYNEDYDWPVMDGKYQRDILCESVDGSIELFIKN